jgi:hypothetical protein
MLENLSDDYEWWSYCKETGTDVFNGLHRRSAFPNHSPRHFRMPFGVRQLTEGMTTDLDQYLENGSTTGLQRIDHLFDELKK